MSDNQSMNVYWETFEDVLPDESDVEESCEVDDSVLIVVVVEWDDWELYVSVERVVPKEDVELRVRIESCSLPKK